jgi:hypothetical protein
MRDERDAPEAVRGRALERRGGGGRLDLWGVPPSGRDRELVPDWAS